MHPAAVINTSSSHIMVIVMSLEPRRPCSLDGVWAVMAPAVGCIWSNVGAIEVIGETSCAGSLDESVIIVVIIVIGWSAIPTCMATIANAAITIIIVASDRWWRSITRHYATRPDREGRDVSTSRVRRQAVTIDRPTVPDRKGSG